MTVWRGIPGDIPDGVCWTCRQLPARWEAYGETDAWYVCNTCRDAGIRQRTGLTYRPTDSEETAA